MRLVTQIAPTAFAVVVAAGCGGSPTAPSLTDPIGTVSSPPFPAPVSQTLTGTWFVGDRRFMTLTQNGASVTGMPAPSTFDAGNGVIISESGLISGVVEGDSVTLTLIDLITVRGAAASAVCTAGHAFRGTLTGNTLSGTMIAGTTPLTCGPGVEIPDIDLSAVSGPAIYTRQ